MSKIKTRSLWRLGGIAGLALGLWACGDSTSSSNPGNTGGAGGGAGGSSSFDGGNGGLPQVLDFRVAPRRDYGEGDGGPAGFREPCNDNLDCASRWCVPFEDRNVCSQTCLDEGCPDGWGCR